MQGSLVPVWVTSRHADGLKTFLGRVIRDIDRPRQPPLNAIFRAALFLAGRVHRQERGERGRKVYSIHAPEVECIGKGKAHKPYEFGVKVSVATTVSAPRGGQFVLASKALLGNPYDGHTPATANDGFASPAAPFCPTPSRIAGDLSVMGNSFL